MVFVAGLALARALRIQAAQRFDMNSLTSAFLAAPARRFAGIQVILEGETHLLGEDRPRVVIANHQSAIDVLTLAVAAPQRIVFIAKKEIIFTPFFGPVFWAGSNLLIDRKNSRQSSAILAQAIKAIRERHVSVWIFPEGTRNANSKTLLPFKKGAFHMAIGAQVPILPMVCSSVAPIWNTRERRFTPGTLRIRVLPEVSTENKTTEQVHSLSQELHTQMSAAFTELNRT